MYVNDICMMMICIWSNHKQ